MTEMNDAAEMLEATQNSQTYTVNSGDWVALTRNENASIKTLSERYENWQGSGITYKHHDWNENFSRHLLNETILVQPNANQSAWFEEIQPAEINNYLLTTGASNVGQIDFHNPWFVESDGSQPDDFLPFSLPYSPTGARDSTTGGVFLDQPFTGNNPHYRVRALEQQINGVIYFLESWSGSNVTFEDNQAEETAVVFQQANATLTAHMKGRRASNTPEATAGNNSRKVIGWWNEASEPFLVYQDYGNIYHAIQADGEWYKDYRQSEGLPGMIYQQPSLYLLHDARSAFTSLDEVIVWDEYDPARERHNLKTSEFPDFPIVDYNNPYPPHPSVAGYVVAPYENPESGTRTAVVAFRGGFQYSSPESSLDGIRLWFTRDGVVHFLNLTSSADYPAIECRKETNYNGSIEPYYQLAWQEEQGIQYLEFDRDNDTGSEVNFYAETILNDDDPLLKDNRHPSIHSDWESGNPANTYVYVVWEALQENGSVEKLVAPITHRGLNCPPASLDVPVFCFREKQNSQWGTLNVFQVNNTC
ncbi:MAG: hypothetical protein GWN14_10005, partial [candidate division Zixibacteria bacterium]|nr:hypothetical protein [Gammaproteobacteria bacterium]NIX56239.1 hypothetical protein [candidate division Zixibacteria bacterium]